MRVQNGLLLPVLLLVLVLGAGARALSLSAGSSRGFVAGINNCNTPVCGTFNTSSGTTEVELLVYIVELDSDGSECCVGSLCPASCRNHRLPASLSDPRWNFVSSAPAFSYNSGTNSLALGGVAAYDLGASSCTPPGTSLEICPTLNFTLRGLTANETLPGAWAVAATSFVLDITVSDWNFGAGATGLRMEYRLAVRQTAVQQLATVTNGRRYRFETGAEDVLVSFPPNVVVNGDSSAPLANASALSSFEWKFTRDLPMSASSDQGQTSISVHILPAPPSSSGAGSSTSGGEEGAAVSSSDAAGVFAIGETGIALEVIIIVAVALCMVCIVCVFVVIKCKK